MRYEVRYLGLDEPGPCQYYVHDTALNVDAGRDQYPTLQLAIAEMVRLEEFYAYMCKLAGG